MERESGKICKGHSLESSRESRVIAKTFSFAIQNIIGIYSIKFCEDQFLCSSRLHAAEIGNPILRRGGIVSRGKEGKGGIIPRGIHWGVCFPLPSLHTHIGVAGSSRDLGCLAFEEGGQCGIAAVMLLSLQNDPETRMGAFYR